MTAPLQRQQSPNLLRSKPFPWVRMLIVLILSVLFLLGAVLQILSTGKVISSYWLLIIPPLVSVIALIIPLLQWLIPVSLDNEISYPSQQPQTTQPIIHAPLTILESPQLSGIWNIPYVRNPIFTGREELLLHLHNQFSENKAETLTLIQAICGLGGMGKTQAAVEYVYLYHNEYRFVLWINATTSESILTDCVKLANFLHLPEKGANDSSTIIAAVKRWLSHQRDWLLILDNAENIATIYDFLLNGNYSTGSILLTTCSQSTGGMIQQVEIKGLEPEEGALLLLRRAKVISKNVQLNNLSSVDHTQAIELSKAVGGLPLALDQAGAYIEETRCSFSHYLHLYQIKRGQLLKQRGSFGYDHPASVATTFQLSFEKVKSANHKAADLLKLFSFLSPDSIPDEIVTKGIKILGWNFSYSVKFISIVWDLFGWNSIRFVLGTYISFTSPVHIFQEQDKFSDTDEYDVSFKWDTAMKELLKYSLVYHNPETNTFTIHRLTQDILKDEMSRRNKRKWAKRAIRTLNRTLFVVKIDSLALWQQYQPQLDICVDLIEQQKFTFLESIHLISQAGKYLQKYANYEQAEALYKRILPNIEKLFGSESIQTITFYYELAIIYQLQSKYEQAEQLYQRILPFFEKKLGPEHPITAKCLDNLACLFREQGKYEQAEPLYRRSLAIHEKILGSDNYETAICLDNLALLYQYQGKYELAEPLHLRALEIFEKSLGPEHPDTATCLFNLAKLYQQQDKYEQADSLYQRSLEIHKKVLGLDHPRTIKTFEGYASFLRLTKRADEASMLEVSVKAPKIGV